MKFFPKKKAQKITIEARALKLKRKIIKKVEMSFVFENKLFGVNTVRNRLTRSVVIIILNIFLDGHIKIFLSGCKSSPHL